MVIRVLASPLTRDQNSATNQQSKESEVAWRNRQAKYKPFARQTLVIPGAVEEPRGGILRIAAGYFDSAALLSG
jgi:hypothetical protein